MASGRLLLVWPACPLETSQGQPPDALNLTPSALRAQRLRLVADQGPEGQVSAGVIVAIEDVFKTLRVGRLQEAVIRSPHGPAGTFDGASEVLGK